MERDGGGDQRHSSYEAGRGSWGWSDFQKYLAELHGVHGAVGQWVHVWGSHLLTGFFAPQVISLFHTLLAMQFYDFCF